MRCGISIQPMSARVKTSKAQNEQMFSGLPRKRTSICALMRVHGGGLRLNQRAPRRGQARTLRAIIKRICAGTLARWALNHENSLALPDWQKYDSHLAASNARGRWWREWQRLVVGR